MRFLRLALIVALGASAAPAAADEGRDRVLAGILRGRPGLVDRLQAVGGGSSNVMFAHIYVGSRHKGYEWSTLALKEGPAARTRLGITFSQTAAEDTQHRTSDFAWTLPRGALSMGRRLKPSSLRTGKGMGSNGSISMALGRNSKYIRGDFPDCTGWVEYRIGKVAGRLRVHLRDQHFRRISLDRASVILYREHDLRCGSEPEPPPCPDHLWLFAEDPETGVTLGAFRTEEGRVDQRVAVETTSGDADALHSISVQVAVPEAFEASDDLTSASIDGDVAGPWLSGDLSYLAPPPATEGTDEDCGAYQGTSGVVTGDYAAHFDSIEDVMPGATGMNATLRRQAP